MVVACDDMSGEENRKTDISDCMSKGERGDWVGEGPESEQRYFLILERPVRKGRRCCKRSEGWEGGGEKRGEITAIP